MLPQATTTQSGNGGSIMDTMLMMSQMKLMENSQNVIWSMFVMLLIGFLGKILNPLYKLLEDTSDQWLEQRKERMMEVARSKIAIEDVTLVKEEMDETTREMVTLPLNRIRFIRDYTTGGNWDQADAMINSAISSVESRRIFVNAGVEIIENMKPILIDSANGVVFQLSDTLFDAKEANKLIHIQFHIESTKLNIHELKKWVSVQTQQHEDDKKNNLGHQKYYFDHIVYGNNSRHSDMIFSKQPFNTNRTMENVFFYEDHLMKQRVRFFRDNKEWYDKRGIPYTLGILLYGPPGTGKTSLIKAICHELDRHIVASGLADVPGKKQMKIMFRDEKITVADGNGSTQLTIPVEKRAYVFEDADCQDGQNSFLMDRTKAKKLKARKEAERKARTPDDGYHYGNQEDDSDDLDLSTVLNLFDGTQEIPGRLVIFSSNHPQDLDPALVRPGRIDMCIELGRMRTEALVRYFRHYFDLEEYVATPILVQIPDFKWTPAEACQIMFRTYDDSEAAAENLYMLTPETEFRLSYVPDSNATADLAVSDLSEDEFPMTPPQPQRRPIQNVMEGGQSSPWM